MINGLCLVLSVACMAVAAPGDRPAAAPHHDALDDLSGPELVALADDLKAAARAQDNPRLEALALVFLDRAQGQTFAIDGRPADLDRSPPSPALTAAAGDDPRIERLTPSITPPDRGREEGPLRQTVKLEPTSGWRTTARFRRNEPTYLYVRSVDRAALHVVVDDPEGRRVCDAEKQDGRVLCAWTPARSGDTLVWVRALNQAAGDIEVLVN